MASVPKVKCARSHEENRQVVCCVCGKKAKEYKGKKSITVVTEKQAALVKEFVFDNYSPQNGFHPTAMCLTCQTTLHSYKKVNIFLRTK